MNRLLIAVVEASYVESKFVHVLILNLEIDKFGSQFLVHFCKLSQREECGQGITHLLVLTL